MILYQLCMWIIPKKSTTIMEPTKFILKLIWHVLETVIWLLNMMVNMNVTKCFVVCITVSRYITPHIGIAVVIDIKG